MQHEHWAIEAGVESNCGAKIKLLFIHQILWMNLSVCSDCRWTSQFTRQRESTLIVDYVGICLHPQDDETSEAEGLDSEPLISECFLRWPQAPLPILALAPSPVSSSPVVWVCESHRDVARMRNPAASPRFGLWCLTPAMLWWPRTVVAMKVLPLLLAC